MGSDLFLLVPFDFFYCVRFTGLYRAKYYRDLNLNIFGYTNRHWSIVLRYNGNLVIILIRPLGHTSLKLGSSLCQSSSTHGSLGWVDEQPYFLNTAQKFIINNWTWFACLESSIVWTIFSCDSSISWRHIVKNCYAFIVLYNNI